MRRERLSMHWSSQRTSQEDATTCIASSGIYFVTRHINWVTVDGEIFYSEAEASAKFDEWKARRKHATGMWDAQLNELNYYGSRGARLGLG